MSKNVAIFSLAYAPFVGGAELAVKEITDRLPQRRFMCFTHRFDHNWPNQEKIGNVEVVRLGQGDKNYYGHFWQKLFYVFRAWRAAEESHRQRPFDVIWAIMAAYGGMAALLFKLKHPKVPMLLTLQEGDSEKHILRRVGIFYPLWRLIFKKADHIQVISNYLADFARRHGARCPVEAVPNGVDISKIKNQKSKIKITNQNSKTVITTSRLVNKNGIDILIRAVANLKPKSYNLKALILGSGPDEEKLKSLTRELGIEDKVKFLGHIKPDKIPEYLSRADIFVRPSRSEGLGSSFLEAMAAGLPIIGTPVGGIIDFLHNGETGLFCKVDNAGDLAKKINLLLSDNQLREKISINGQKAVLENYSWDKIAAKMMAIFNSLHSTLHIPHPIKVLIATGLYPPEIGGPATYTALLEQELPKRGFAVAVLPFRVVRRWPIGFRHFFYFLKCFWLAMKSDVIYAQDPVSVGLPSMLAAKLSGRRFIIRIAGDYAWEQAVQRFGVKDGIDEFQSKKYGWRAELLRKIQKFVVSKADLVITPSKYFQKLVSGWVKNSEKVKAIYNGINLGNQESGIRNQEKKEKTILSAGRLVPWKGFDFLIDLMKDLPDWKLVIVGDGPEYQELKVKSEKLKVNNRVNLVGAVPREKLLEHLRNSRLFVLNTSFESFSFQIVEAMNAGVPVIATRIGNLEEIIEDGKEGILVEPNNKEQFLAAIAKIEEDSDFRRKIIESAKKKAQEFPIEKTTEKLTEILEGVTNSVRR